MKDLPGLSDRLRAQLRALGYWKHDRPDVRRFCALRGYRPQYVYAWLKNRTPTAAYLRRLARDLDTSMAWLAFGVGAPDSAERIPMLAVAAEQGATPAPPGRDGRSRKHGRRLPVKGHAASRVQHAHSAPDTNTAEVTRPARILDFRRLRDATERLVALEGDLEAIVSAFPDGYIWLDADGQIVSSRAGRGLDLGLPEDGRVGRALESVFPEGLAAALRAALRQALETRSVVGIEVILPGDRGRVLEARLVSIDRRTEARALAVIRDITEQKRAETMLRTLVEIGRELVGTLDLKQVAGRIVAAAVRLLRVARANMWQIDATSGDLMCVAGTGEADTGAWIGRVFPAGTGLAGLAVTEGRPVASTDIVRDPRVTLAPDAREVIVREGLRKGYAFPLRGRAGLVGVLAIVDAPERNFSPDDTRVLTALSDMAAVALENARLYADAETRRVAAERLVAVVRAAESSRDPGELIRHAAEGGCSPSGMVARPDASSAR